MINIETISKSGQCFRIKEIEPHHYEAIIKNQVVDIYQGEEVLMISSTTQDVQHYFRLDEEDIKITDPDPFLAKAIAHSPGLAILRQDPWEVLVSFIISQRKSIPAIKNSIERMCKAYGTPMDDAHYAFPTAEQLIYLDKDDCGLGYRKNYIRQLARDVVDGKFSMEALTSADYKTAKMMLLSINGVGEKVANCVLLFGLGFDNAFPVDVHIRHVLDEHYPNGFPYEKYDGQLGLVQQYLFEYQRYLAKKR